MTVPPRHGESTRHRAGRLKRAAGLLASALLLAAGPAGAKSGTELQVQRGEVASRIRSLQRDLDKKEESRAGAVDRLREAESAISDANRRLRQLAAERGALQEDVRDLEAQGVRLDRQTARQQTQLERLLLHQFIGGEGDALQSLIAGRDPNQAARDRYFMTRLSHAKADLIRELRGVADEKRRLADGVRDRQARLAEVESRQQEQRAQLLEKQKQRQATLVALASAIKARRDEIGALKRDEQRLTTLIAGLAKPAAQRPRAGRGKVGAGETATPAVPRAGSPVRDADPGAVGAFGALRGKLRLPVAGSVSARFGAPRAEGGTAWRGLFIRAAEGADVLAVAAGTVVHADWMRGFGNLLIVDHGDDFLSIYGNNQSLLRTAGQQVRSGETVATAGSSGGNPESGLYFELRHRGQPFDPMKWLRR